MIMGPARKKAEPQIVDISAKISQVQEWRSLTDPAMCDCAAPLQLALFKGSRNIAEDDLATRDLAGRAEVWLKLPSSDGWAIYCTDCGTQHAVGQKGDQ